MLCLLLRVHLVPSTPTWGEFLLPVLMLVPYLMSPASDAVPFPSASQGGGSGPHFPGDLKLFH